MRKSLAGTVLVLPVLLLLAGTAWAGWDEGLAAFKAGKLDEAAKQFEGVVAQQPDWYGGHFMLGQVLLKQNKNSDALEHLRKAYDLNPGEVSVQLPLAKAYLGTNRNKEAAELLGKIDPASLPKAQQAALFQMQAVAFDKSGQGERALAALGKAAAANPNDAALQLNYGSTALNLGDTATALKALEKAAALDTKSTDTQRVYLQALMRAGRERQGSAKTQAYQKAVTVARSLSTRESTYQNLLLLGEAQLGATDYGGAATTFQQAAGKSSGEFWPYFYTGQAYTATGEYDRAEAALKQALDRSRSAEEKGRIWRQLGFVYEKKKDFNQAKAAYSNAGDPAAVKRVEENQQISKYNLQVEAEAEKIKALEEERKKLEEELKELPGGPPPLR